MYVKGMGKESVLPAYLEHLKESLLRHLNALKLLLLIDGRLDDLLKIRPVRRGDDPETRGGG